MNEELKLYPYLHLSMLENIAEKASYNRYELRYKILGGANINNMCKKLSLKEDYIYTEADRIPFFIREDIFKRQNEESKRYNNFLKVLKDELNIHNYEAIIVDMSWDVFG